MKKADPIQLTILIVALLLGYNALNLIPYFLWAFYNWFIEGLRMDGAFSRVGLNFLYFVFYAGAAAVLVKRSKLLSLKIAGTAGFSSGAGFELKRNDIIYASMIILGSYILATRLPRLLVKSYMLIKESNQPFYSEGPNYILPGETIGELVFNCIFGTVLLVYAKTLTDYITRHVKDDDPDVETIGAAEKTKEE